MLEAAILADSESAVVEAVKEAIASVSPGARVRVLFRGDRLDLSGHVLFCPLTLQLPETLDFPAGLVYQACADVSSLQRLVREWEYKTGTGNLWLPIAFTAKGPLYAEVISSTMELSYYQPLHLSDRWRQQIYQLGYRLLQYIKATPSVYLMQFGFDQSDIWFDKLLPFPDTPALASLGVQRPDLFTCYWYCLTGKPLRDLTILPQDGKSAKD